MERTHQVQAGLILERFWVYGKISVLESRVYGGTKKLLNMIFRG